MTDCVQQVVAKLRGHARLAVAVSGGIDSLTLATIAGRHHADVVMLHAVSPAVQPDATARVRQIAREQRWTLHEIDAGEFEVGDYMSNPVNRCYFCKEALYGGMRSSLKAIANATTAQIVSGTNADDLGEYRPGLQAAREFGVRHPFADLGITKTGVRELARAVGLGTLSDLPASPCLSSRIETGIPISAEVLACVYRAEQAVRAMLPEALAIRCRVRASGVVVEIDATTHAVLDPVVAQQIVEQVRDIMRTTPHAATTTIAPYRVGSAFLTDAIDRRHQQAVGYSHA